MFSLTCPSGLEIWKIENALPLALPRSQYGRFCCGQSYIILQTWALKSGGFHYDIHYWLGRSRSQNEAAAAAVKAVELNASLGGRAVLTREVEGHESDKFLSYFKPCFIPIEQGTTLNAAVEGAHHQNRMFLCKGRHIVHVKEVPFTRSSLSHDNVFVLHTKSKIFQFNGANTDIYERAKALDVVQYLKENFHKEKCHIATVEDGKFVADADSGEFWGLFGGFAPLMRKMDDEDYDEVIPTAGTLFTILEGQLDKLQASPLKREMLGTNKCYILDCGKELFTWVGRDTSLQDRKATILVAEELSAKHKNPHGIKLVCAIEGFEPVEFRSKFNTWPISTTLPISEGGREKVAALLKQKGFNVKGILKTAQAQEKSQLFRNIGKLQVWCVNGSSKECLPSSEHGKFSNNTCYVVLHTCLNKKEEHLVCSWLGHKSTMETRATAAHHANDIASSLQENVVEVRIFEGKEPTQFLSLFDKLFIIKDNEKKDGVSLFQVHQSDPLRWHAIQVAAVATSLNSSSCFFSQTGDSFFTCLHGKSFTETSNQTGALFHPDVTAVTSLKEGSETQIFWDTLGGRQIYPSHHELKDSAKDPRLFSCPLVKGYVKVTEVFNFTQEDLLSDEIMVLDCYTDIFVWVGQAHSSQHKLKALEFGQKYLEKAAKYEGTSLETPIFKIIEGCEPLLFTSRFCWDATKVKHHLNPFERKVLALKGESIQATEVTRSRRRPPVSDGKGFQLVADKTKLSQNLTFKPEHSMDRTSQPKSKTGFSRLTTKSAAVSALSTMFEFQNGREAPPNTPIVKLPKLSLKTKATKTIEPTETLKDSPPATPYSSRTPRSAVSPAIATLASVFESYHDRFAFAWPGDFEISSNLMFQVHTTKQGNSFKPSCAMPVPNKEEFSTPCWLFGTEMKSRHEEKAKASRELEAWGYGTVNRTIEEAPTSSARSFVDMANKVVDQTYPYERLKLSSSDPVLGIDSSKRESYLSGKEFQETFHMDKDTFYKLPRWKQDKYKVLLDLF